MHAEIEGPPDGVDVVLLHGGIGTGRFHWSQQIDALAEQFRVHLPDLPGHGGTPLPPDVPYERDVHVDAVEAYLEKVGPPVHVAGFSMGGNACLTLAERRPELFASLILVGVAIREHPGLQGWRDRFDPDRFERESPLWVRKLSRIHEPLGGPDAWREVLRRDSAGLLVDVDLGALESLECPVLLIRGDRDRVVDPSHYAELRERWGERAEELVVPAGGHDVQLTRHQIVRPALLDFLGRVT